MYAGAGGQDADLFAEDGLAIGLIFSLVFALDPRSNTAMYHILG